jgi:hypothetical protein
MLDSVSGSTFPITEMSHSPRSPYFLNYEFFLSTKKTRYMNLPEGLFVIPEPIFRTGKREGLIKSRVSPDFSLDNSISVNIRISKIKDSIKYDAVYYSGGIYEYPIPPTEHHAK